MIKATQMQQIQRILAMSFLGLLLAAGAPAAADAQAHQANVRERLYGSDLIEETRGVETASADRAARSGGAEAPRVTGLHQGEVLARLYSSDRVETSPPSAPGPGARTDSLLARDSGPWNSGPHQANVRERLYSRDLLVAPWVRLAASSGDGDSAPGGSDR